MCLSVNALSKKMFQLKVKFIFLSYILQKCEQQFYRELADQKLSKGCFKMNARFNYATRINPYQLMKSQKFKIILQ